MKFFTAACSTARESPILPLLWLLLEGFTLVGAASLALECTVAVLVADTLLPDLAVPAPADDDGDAPEIATSVSFVSLATVNASTCCVLDRVDPVNLCVFGAGMPSSTPDIWPLARHAGALEESQEEEEEVEEEEEGGGDDDVDTGMAIELLLSNA